MNIGRRELGEVRSSDPSTFWDGNEPLILCDGWALGADKLQWMVMQARRHKGNIKWQPVAFIRSETSVLRRFLRDLDVRITPAGDAALNAFPESFDAWREATR